MINQVNSIEIGTGAIYDKQSLEAYGFSVWKKTRRSGEVSYVIGRLLRAKTWEISAPGSVLQEFATLTLAEDALRRWATLQEQPKLLRKPNHPTSGARRRNSNRPKKKKAGFGQMEFSIQSQSSTSSPQNNEK